MSPLTAVRRCFARGHGRHRPGSQPYPALVIHDETMRIPILNEDDFARRFNSGDIEANECAPCRPCGRTTVQALRHDGTRTCFMCNTTTPGE